MLPATVLISILLCLTPRYTQTQKRCCLHALIIDYRVNIVFLIYSRYAISIVASTTDANYQSQTKEWLKGMGTALSKFSLKPDPSKMNTVMQRLRQVKRQYDPENIFKYNNNIDPN